MRTVEGGDDSWDGVWFSAGIKTDYGWQVEAAIPFKTLRFPQNNNQVWGIQILRVIQRKGEYNSYVPLRKCENNQLERMAELTGINSISDQRLFDITPYFTSKYDEYIVQDKHYNANIGADIKYGIGSNVIVDATINPDFGHIEADIDYVNLSPYELYLQDKRPFFLENMKVFETPFSLFYSRRIADPDAGVKLTGKIGQYNIGAFYAHDNNEQFDNKDNYGIARIEREVMKQSYIGFMTTYVRKKNNYYNSTLSTDWRLIKAPFSFSGQIALSDTKNYDRLNWKGTTKIAYYRNNLRLSYSYSFYERNFYADAGFIFPLVIDKNYTPFSYRTNLFNISYDWYINKYNIQSVSPLINSYVQHNYDGKVLVQNIAPSISISFEKNISITLGSYLEKRFWEEEYFNTHMFSIYSSINPSKFWKLFFGYEEGQTLDYWNVSSVWQKYFNFQIDLNPSEKIEIIPSVYHISQYEYQHGPRTYNQWNGLLRLGYSPNKKMFAKLFVQGNSYNNFYTANILFGYEFLPGSTFYLAYNSDYLHVNEKFEPETRILFVKISLLTSI